MLHRLTRTLRGCVGTDLGQYRPLWHFGSGAQEEWESSNSPGRHADSYGEHLTLCYKETIRQHFKYTFTWRTHHFSGGSHMIGMQVFISGHMLVMWSWMIPTPVLPSSHQASQNRGNLQSRRQQESHKSWKPVQVKALIVTLFPSLHHLQALIACNTRGAWPNRSTHLNDVR